MRLFSALERLEGFLLPTMVLRVSALVIAISAVQGGVAEAGTAEGCRPKFSVRDGVIEISNKYYEFGLRDTDGGFLSLVDNHSKGHLLGGRDAGRLWWADVGNTRVNSSSYKGFMSHSWNAATSELELKYTGMSENKPDVSINIAFDDSPVIRLSATVTNTGKSEVKTFSLPGDLKIPIRNMMDGLLPMLPGALLSREFFTDLRKYDALYPGGMFADYLAIRTTAGNLAVYGGAAKVLQPTSLGFESVGGSMGQTRLIHSFRTWVEAGKTWQSPPVYVHIGSDYPQSISVYRKYKGIDKFKSIDDKLQPNTWRFYSAPLYKLDMTQARTTFIEAKNSIVDKLRYPGILHLVAYQPEGFDKHYPNFLPPNPMMGSEKALRDLLSYAKSKGHLVIPYTNFSWWNDEEGIALREVAAKKSDGTPIFEKYGLNGGYVVDPFHPSVMAKISEQITRLWKSIGVDAIFEDQWGARPAPMNYSNNNNKLDPSTSYFMGVLQHTATHQGKKLMTECGVDVLAEYEVGFHGTNLLWDQLGYKPETAPYTSYYPMAGMLLRDKVLLYQHDLAFETFSHSKEMLRWNLAMGYNQSVYYDNSWAEVAGAFQKHVGPRYASSLATEFTRLSPEVTVTSFNGHKVYANWNSTNPQMIDGFGISESGMMVRADDNSFIAGVFNEYNGLALSSGDHYLIEVRDGKSIRIYQPKGGPTYIRVSLPDGWKRVIVTGKQADGRQLLKADAKIESEFVRFFYELETKGKRINFYEVTQ